MTSQDPHPPGREPVTTYGQAQDTYRGTFEARERFDELTSRDLSARAFATLKARGSYDPARHGDADKHQPLITAEHLELLAAGEVLARHYRHPGHIHQALDADATWPQIAEAVGSDQEQVRQQYREWADSQHRLHTWYEGRFGLNDADYATAMQRRRPAHRTRDRARGRTVNQHATVRRPGRPAAHRARFQQAIRRKRLP